MSRYSPCRDGIHVCGIDDTKDEFVTVANIPAVSRQRFEVVLREAHAVDGDPDLVVDFMVDGDIIKYFGIRRQSLAALSE